MKKFFASHDCMQRGFSYVGVLLSVVLLGILLVPALQALNMAIPGNTGNQAARQYARQSKMEEVLSRPFGALYAETYLAGGNTTTSVSANFSDTAGATDRLVVVLYRYDAITNALSGNDTGLLYVNVYYESDGSAYALNTLASRWW
jgi:Tfp pilus assembly protein PilV